MKISDLRFEMNLETVETLLQSSKGAALQDLIKQSLISPSIFHYESILTVSPSRMFVQKRGSTEREGSLSLGDWWIPGFIEICLACVSQGAGRII